MPELAVATQEFLAAMNSAIGAAQEPELAVRRELRKWINEPNFVSECLIRVTRSIEEARSQWKNPPILRCDRLDFAVRIIYWPPGFSNNPHSHAGWSVSGILWGNGLSMTRYRLLPGASQPDVEKVFVCCRGEVGYVKAGAVHSVANPTESTAVSIHVFAGRGNPTVSPDEGTKWYPDPEKGAILSGARDRALRANIEIALRLPREYALRTLSAVFSAASPEAKLIATKAIAVFDTTVAGDYLEQLAGHAAEPARHRFVALATRLRKSGL